MVGDPAEYRWSSYRHHALGDANGLISDQAEFLALGKTPRERQEAYRAGSDQ